MNSNEASQALIQAEKTKETLEAFTSNSKVTKDEAYQIQLNTIDYKVMQGAKIVGKNWPNKQDPAGNARC